MTKKKDPAMLVFTQDWLVGVIGLTWEEQGRYWWLICVQHQKGHIDIDALMPDCPDNVRAKFTKDEDGLYFNKRAEEEINRRAKYAESRRQNGKQGGRPKAQEKQTESTEKPYGFSMLSNEKPYENHTETETETETDSLTSMRKRIKRTKERYGF